MAQTELQPLPDHHVLVRNLFMSVDPYMRGRMNAGKSYVPPFELGKPLEGGAVGEIIESRAKEFKPGDAVTSSMGWREYFIASPKMLRPVSREVQPLSVYLGALGMTGMASLSRHPVLWSNSARSAALRHGPNLPARIWATIFANSSGLGYHLASRGLRSRRARSSGVRAAPASPIAKPTTS
jgi:hypothetical protein